MINYTRLKKEGFRFVTKDYIGGECAHKVKPKRADIGFWHSDGWRYVQEGTACENTKELLSIDIAIKRVRKKRADEARRRKQEEAKKAIDKRTHTCVICGTIFDYPNAAKKYCSGVCHYESISRAKRVRKGQTLVYYDKECEICGKPFTTVQDSRTACSDMCALAVKQKAIEEESKRIQEILNEKGGKHEERL